LVTLTLGMSKGSAIVLCDLKSLIFAIASPPAFGYYTTPIFEGYPANYQRAGISILWRVSKI
jgi:hypothetical protein